MDLIWDGSIKKFGTTIFFSIADTFGRSGSNSTNVQRSTVPLEVYSHALNGNRNIIHISFFRMRSDFVVNRFLCDLPWVTSISPDWSVAIPAIHRDLLFIKTTNNDLNTFAKEIKLDLSSTYIFSDVGFLDVYADKLRSNARVLISFVAPTSGKSLILRVKHSGKEDAPLDSL